MKFSFSKQFRQSEYAALLREIGGLMDDLFTNSGCQVKSSMADLRISHPSLKKY